MDSYYEMVCPSCKTANLVCNGDESDYTVPDVEEFRCRKCKSIIKIPESEDGELISLGRDDGRFVRDGLPVPKRKRRG